MRSDHEQRHGSRCDTSGNAALEDSLQVRSRLAVRCLCYRSPPMLTGTTPLGTVRLWDSVAVKV